MHVRREREMSIDVTQALPTIAPVHSTHSTQHHPAHRPALTHTPMATTSGSAEGCVRPDVEAFRGRGCCGGQCGRLRLGAACILFSGFRGTAKCGQLQEDKACRGVHCTYVVMLPSCRRLRVRADESEEYRRQKDGGGVPPRKPRRQCSPTSIIFPAL